MTPPTGSSDTALAGAGSVRGSASGSETPLPPSDITDLFAALEKAIRAKRLYQPNNPAYRGFITAARAAIQRLWPHTSSFTAGVEENVFRWYGRAFPAGEGRESLPFLFYKDGIRFITLLPGFEDELERFLDVINAVRAQDQNTDDDMVTLLWQQEFTSFQYSFVDALAEGLQVPQSTVPKLVGIELTLVPDDATPAPRGSAPPSPAVEAGQPPVAGLVSRSDFEETLYFLGPTELAHLKREVELEWERPVRQDVLNALFDRLEEGLPLWKPEILRILRQMLPVFLGAGDLPSATQILIELNGLLESGGLEPAHRAEAQHLFRELSEPAVLTQLMRSLEDGSIDPSGSELGVFLQHLGPDAMPVLLAAMERTEVVTLQERLSSAISGLAAAHRDRLLALLREHDADVVRGAARLLGQLGVADAAAPLGELLPRGDIRLRRVIVDALVRIRNSTALDALMRAFDDPDREVRITAVRGVASLRYAPARPRLEGMLDSKTVRDADLTEKIAFFEAYGAVANADSVSLLDRMLNGRRLLQKQGTEVRACAAMALGRVGSPAARAALQRAQQDGNAMVRNAVLKALQASHQESA